MTPATVPALTLNNGVTMPALGLGVFQSPPEETTAAVEAALREGYRHIDTAAAYGNEREVGDAMILHQALPSAFDCTLQAYRALEKLLADGRVRAIGVSNFMVDHLTRLLAHASVVPAVNQIEQHPYFVQAEVEAFGAEHGILVQAWSPIGGITFYRDSGHRSALEDPVIGDIAQAHGKSPAQVMLRWGLQLGRSVIPKSTKPERIAENIDVFDFELSTDQMAAIDTLDTNHRGGPEPDAVTLEAFGRDIPEA
jgi:diketogulonate reductase-like aldo/keto reductase